LGVDVGGLSGLPGSATWPPARYRPPVFVVPRAEPALQLRLLQPVDPGDQRERDETHVPPQVWPPQQNRLAEDRGVEREVYGVAHVRVQAADDEVRGGATGAGVPSPSTTNRANADTSMAVPATTSTAPSTRSGTRWDSGAPGCQPVISHGTSPTMVPGARAKKTALPAAAAVRCMVVILSRRVGGGWLARYGPAIAGC